MQLELTNQKKGAPMNDVITNILTDVTARDAGAVEDALVQQAVATPWIN